MYNVSNALRLIFSLYLHRTANLALWAKAIVLSKTVAVIGNFSDLVHTAASETTTLKIQKGTRTCPSLLDRTVRKFLTCHIINDIAKW